jgi:hypothetical protein
MELLDSRRLTGPNFLWDREGAVLDGRGPLETWRHARHRPASTSPEGGQK